MRDRTAARKGCFCDWKRDIFEKTLEEWPFFVYSNLIAERKLGGDYQWVKQ